MALIGDLVNSLRKARLENILEPGERVLLRLPLIPSWIPIFAMASGALVLLSAGARYLAASNTATSSLNAIWGVVLAILSIFMIMVGLFQYLLFRNLTVVVTDRRILQRLGRQNEEIRLADIEEIKPCLPEDGLFVTGGGRKLAITCRPKKAERLRAAIEAAKEGAAP